MTSGFALLSMSEESCCDQRDPQPTLWNAITLALSPDRYRSQI